MNLREQLDYMGKLSSQLEWQNDPKDRPVRLVYTSSGQPTAAILSDNAALVENVLFWVACRGIEEANYLLSIINSNAAQETVKPLMAKGQFGARHLHKHLWKLTIPEFNPVRELHAAISEAGATAAAGATVKLNELREQRGDRLTGTIARRELRKWLRASDEGQAVETVVTMLLAGE